jgi:hypothetical protein
LERPAATKSGKQTQQSAPQERGTKENPVFLGGEVTTQRSEHRTEWEKSDVEAKAKIDSALVEYTEYLAWFTGALACIALLQAGLFVWQLLFMRRGLSDSEKAADAARISADASRMGVEVAQRGMIAQHRAYVSVMAYSLSVLGQKATIKVAARNTGLTPARKLNASCLAVVGPFDWTKADLAPKRQNVGALLPPEQQRFFGDAVDATAQQWREIQGGRLPLSVIGDVAYEDVFGAPHWTKFCFNVQDINRVPNDAGPGMNFTFYAVDEPYHNDAT